MPELPEVETVVRTLEKQIKHAFIKDIEVRYARIIEREDVENFKKSLIGASFESFLRRGKYLHFIMSNDLNFYVHLRMEGKFYIYDTYEECISKHIHIIFALIDGRYLCYNDTRKFGRFYLSPKDIIPSNISKLGYEPFDENLNPQIVYELLQKSRLDLKSFLLDQEIICGIGNIYANEICFMMSCYPGIACKDLNMEDATNLYHDIKEILLNAIKAGGTTIRSYTSSLGVSGLFQLQVLVQSKENEPCAKCQSPIKKIMLHQRGTYYCEVCQCRGMMK